MKTGKNFAKLEEELLEWRRSLHRVAETGVALPKTTAYIENELKKMGYAPKKIGKGSIFAEVGEGEIFLLRADMDALSMVEKTGLPFSCKTGNMHACGHDLHASMLLGAAKLLKNCEKELSCRVRLVFQGAEEILEGAKDVIKAGGMSEVKGAMTVHVMTDVDLPAGTIVVANGVSAPCADFFTIEVKGKSCHGATPWKGVDVLSASAHILVALEEISARELNPATPTLLTIGSMHGGEAGNVIAESVEMKGTLRSMDEDVRAEVKKRMEEIVKNVAKAFRATAKVKYKGGCPTLVNDENLSMLAKRTAKSLFGADMVWGMDELSQGVQREMGGSEDFAYFSHEAPSIICAVAAGERKKGYVYPLHHPKVDFDEGALVVGARLFSHMALSWRGNSKG